MMKTTGLVLGMILVLAAPMSVLQAEEAPTRAQVEALLVEMKADAMIDAAYKQMDTMLAGMATQLKIVPSEQIVFDRFMAKMIATMKAEMSWEKMQPAMIDVYVKNFTARELADILAFYRTETGRSMLAKMPVVMQDSMALAQAMLKNFMPKIQVMAQELQTELQTLRASSIAKTPQ